MPNDVRPIRLPLPGGSARTRRIRPLGAAGACLLLAVSALPAGAQERDTLRAAADTTVAADTAATPDSVRFRLQGLRVEASRPTIVGGGASAVRLRLDSARSVPSPTLAEVLRDMPLIRVRQNSRGQVQPSLRGMEERQIAVLVDGVPITLGWDNRADLSVIPLTAAREIRLVRGLSSVLAGPNALGGVVEVEISGGQEAAEAAPDPLTLRAAVEHTGAVALSGESTQVLDAGSGRLSVRYGGGYRQTDGLVLPGGLTPIARDEDDLLVNSDTEYGNGFLALRWQGGPREEWLSLSSAAFAATRGVVPELHLVGGPDPEPRFWRIPDHRRWVTAVAAGTGWGSTPWGEGDIEVALGLDFQHLEIDAFDSMAYGDSVDGETGSDRTLSFRLLGDHTLGDGTLRGALTVAETWHEEILASAPSSEYRQRLWSLGVETEQPLGPRSTGGVLESPSLTAGFSLDGSSTPETGGSPPQPAIRGWGGRLAAQVGVSDALALHGGVSRKVRFPALRELYSGALGRFAPNPDLDPLTLWVAEAAATARPAEGLEIQGAVFEQRLVGAIVRAVLPDGRFQRQNRGDTRATGLELLATIRLGGLGLRGDLTLQDVRLVDGEGGSEGERPEYQPEVVAGLDVESPPFLGIRAFGGLEHLGSQFGANPETGEFERIEPTTYLEAGAARRFEDPRAGLPPFTLSVTAENLADALIFDQLGLPRPGRTLRLEVRVF